MWTLFGVILVFIKTIHGLENITITYPDLMNILRSDHSENISEICAKHLEEYLLGIQNSELWALRMFDSITKFPDGVLMGHFGIPGHFDECVMTSNEDFSGKHCMVKLNVIVPKKNSPLPANAQNFRFSYGFCFPSTCRANDIINAIKSLNLDFVDAELKESDCSVSGFRPLRTEDWVTIAVLIFFFIAALGSTGYDSYQRFMRKNENPNQLLSAFSFYSNGKQLFKISQNTTQLKCLHGVRFLSMCWVILGHSYLSYLLGAPMNMADAPSFLQDKSFIPVTNAFVSVDSFFFLSGLLVCLVFFRDIYKKKTFDVPVAFIHRYMRLTPPFAILMLIQATIISRIGNGPFWNEKSDKTENDCRKIWWSGVLYIQNYIKPTAMCLGQAWYLSADMQMYWISPLILYPLLWFPYIAPYFILLLVLTAASVNFAVTFVNNLSPNLLTKWDSDLLRQFEIEYSPFHTRMAPWIIGLATGYIICGMQAKKVHLKLSKMMVVIGWIGAGFLLGGSLFGLSRFLSDPYTQLETSLYLSLHRVGWALGLSWVVIACIGGYGGPINDFLSIGFFEPLGKLCYCNFLIHMTLQNYRINSSRTNQYLRHFDVVYSYFGDIFISNLLSIPVVLLFEFPFIKIDRYLFQTLTIYPLPKPKKEYDLRKAKELEKPVEEFIDLEKPVEKTVDLEKGKDNLTFSES